MTDPNPMNATVARLGNVFQLGFVSEDLEGAIAFWSGMLGAGPFFTIPRVHELLARREYYGEPSDVEFSATVGYLGDRQIEVIQPLNDSPSIYRDWLSSGRTGLHHASIQVADLEEARAMTRSIGAPVAQEFRAADGSGVIYLDMGETAPVRYLELYQFAPSEGQLFARMRMLSETWDGADPLREIDWNM
jgi:hypothetical protein